MAFMTKSRMLEELPFSELMMSLMNICDANLGFCHYRNGLSSMLWLLFFMIYVDVPL